MDKAATKVKEEVTEEIEDDFEDVMDKLYKKATHLTALNIFVDIKPSWLAGDVDVQPAWPAAEYSREGWTPSCSIRMA